MSIADYEIARQIMSQYPGKAHFIGERPADLVLSAQRALGLTFPPSYLQFVEELGAGNFGAFEVYGVTDADFHASVVPNGIWYTVSERLTGMPNHLVVIGDVGDGGLYCLDLKRQGPSAEGPVVIYYPGYPVNTQQFEVVAPNFGAFLLRGVRRQADRLK